MAIQFPDPTVTNPWQDPVSLQWWNHDGDGWVRFVPDVVAVPIMTGYKNILINGNFRVNQRVGTKTPGVGVYGFDRWKGHVDGLEQVIEEVNYLPSVEYMLSGTNVPATQITSPASGDWSITVPDTANLVQLERGTVATDFELRNIQQEESLCFRYYFTIVDPFMGRMYSSQNLTNRNTDIWFPVAMRIPPIITTTVANGTIGIIDSNIHFASVAASVVNETDANKIMSFIANAEI